MPRKQVFYYCDICNKSFSTEKKAADCEKSHFKVKYVDKVDYSIEDDKREYPESILIALENDKGVEKKVRYYRR